MPAEGTIAGNCIPLSEGESMNDMRVQPSAAPAPQASGLTQWQRVADTFVAPQKTFDDIKRGNRSWWLPWIISALLTYVLFGAIVQKIGIQQVVDNQIRMSPRTQEQMAQLTPEQRDKSNKLTVGIAEGTFIAVPVLGLVYAVVIAAVLLGTINFGFGGRAKFGDIFAVIYYAWLPGIIKVLLGMAVIYGGMAPESFNAKNFAPTNLGAFLDPVDTNKALYALATSLDAVTIWTLVLLSIGVAAVAGVKRSSGYIAVFGWWAVVVLASVGIAAIMG
jgi:hypothetical protein